VHDNHPVSLSLTIAARDRGVGVRVNGIVLQRRRIELGRRVVLRWEHHQLVLNQALFFETRMIEGE
jgi:hypothetical protein